MKNSLLKAIEIERTVFIAGSIVNALFSSAETRRWLLAKHFSKRVISHWGALCRDAGTSSMMIDFQNAHLLQGFSTFSRTLESLKRKERHRYGVFASTACFAGRVTSPPVVILLFFR